MRKSDLIGLLQNIQGNPEIKLWNGMVGDWMDINKNLVPATLVKQTFEHYVEMIRLEQCMAKKDWSIQLSAEEISELRQSYKKYIKWEFNQFVDEEDVKAKRYSRKNIFYIDAKRRGVTTYDRIGNLEY